MVILRISGFGGIIPRLGKRLLPDNNAQYAMNAQLFSGELRSWESPLLLETFFDHPNLKDVYHYRHKGSQVDHYIPFDRRTDVVKAPIINDAFDRLYWTDGVQFTITTMADVEAGTLGAPVGLAAPVFGTKPEVTATGGVSANAVTRAYTFILVSKYGEEGPAIDSSTVTTSGNSDGTWTVTNLDTLVAPTNPNTIALRMYRTISTASNATYRSVVEWPIGSIPSSYVDTLAETSLATKSALESLAWDAPPADLQGLCSGPGGMLSAFKGNTVYFSVPYFPHAWPDSFKLAIPDNIVAMGWIGSMLIIGTTGRPAVVSGTGPTSLSLQNFGEVIPCLNADGFVATSSAALFPSLDGLMAFSSDGANNVTNTYATREDWLTTFNPSQLSGAVYQNRFFGFYSTQLGFSLGFDDATTALTNLQWDGITRMKNSAVDNSAHIISGHKLLRWDAANLLPLLYVWRSKPFLVPKPVNFGVIQIRASYPRADPDAPAAEAPPPIVLDPQGYEINAKPIDSMAINGFGLQARSLATDVVGVKIYCDGKLRWVGVISSEAPVNLPSGYKGVAWEIELSGTLSIFSVVLAGNRSELDKVP